MPLVVCGVTGRSGSAFAYEQHANPLQQFHGSELAFRQPDIGQVFFAATIHRAGEKARPDRKAGEVALATSRKNRFFRGSTRSRSPAAHCGKAVPVSRQFVIAFRAAVFRFISAEWCARSDQSCATSEYHRGE